MRGKAFLMTVLSLATLAIGQAGCRRSEIPVTDPPGTTQEPGSSSSSAPVNIDAWELAPPASVAAELALLHENSDLGPKTYAHYCAACHGEQGKGDGIYFADSVEPRPTDLTDTAIAGPWTDEHLQRLVRQGSSGVGKSPFCPPWGRVFSDEQVTAVVKHVRSLAGSAASE